MNTNTKRLLFIMLSLLSLLPISLSLWCKEIHSGDDSTRAIETEQTVKREKANGFYGEVTFIDRKSKMITINQLDISGKDVAQVLDKSDYVKIKILVVYPTTKSVVAEIIDSNKMWNLKNGSKKFFVTDAFEKLIKEKIFLVYGKIVSIDRKFKQIVIDQLDISSKDITEALKKNDYTKIKIVAVYPSTKSVLAETIPPNEIRYLKKGSKDFFITDTFEKLIKEIEDFMSNGDKSLNKKAYKNAVDYYKRVFTKDVYKLYPLVKNKLEFAQAQYELQKLKEQLKLAEEKRQCGNEQEAIKNYEKAIEYYELVLQKNTKIGYDTQQKVGFAYWNLALAFSRNGTLDKATEYCKKAFMLIDSDDIDIKKQLGEDCMKYGIQRYVSADYAGARKCFEFGIELFPSSNRFRIHINLAHAETLLMEATKHRKQEMHSAALEKYNETISIYKKLATQKEDIDIYEKIAIERDFICKELKEKIFLIENQMCVVRIQKKEVGLKTLFAEKERLPTDLARCQENLNRVKAKKIRISSDLSIAQQKARIFYDLDYGLPLIAQEAEKIKFARGKLRRVQEMEKNIRREIFSLQNAPAQNEKQIKLVEDEIAMLKSARFLLIPYCDISWGSTYKETKQALEDKGYRILVEEHSNTQFFIYDRILGEKGKVGFLFNATNQLNSISQGYSFSDDNTKTLKKVQSLLVAQYGEKGTFVQEKELSLPAVLIQKWLYEDRKPRVVILQNRKTNEVVVTYYAPSEYWNSE